MCLALVALSACAANTGVGTRRFLLLSQQCQAVSGRANQSSQPVANSRGSTWALSAKNMQLMTDLEILQFQCRRLGWRATVDMIQRTIHEIPATLRRGIAKS